MVYVPIQLLLYPHFMYQLLIVNTAGASGLKIFSRGVADFQTIRTYSGVSVNRCGEECSRRNRCQGVIYHKRSALCTLTPKLNLNETVADDGGIVLLTEFNAGGSAICGSNVCPTGEACIPEGNGHVCKPTECGQPPSFYTNVQGNMYAGKNTLIFKGGSSYMRVTCQDNGLWEPEDSRPDIMKFLRLRLRMFFVFQRRQDGTEDFQRNWNDYVGGFGDIDGEFWLGLEPLFDILQTGDFELRIDLEKFSGERAYAKYSTFTVAGPQDNYRLGVSGYTGNAGDSLAPTHNGRMFSTRDNDNDGWGRNCADNYKGGWWYSNCHLSSLNGPYFHSGHHTKEWATHIHWYTWTGHYYSLKRTEMKIRRKWN